TTSTTGADQFTRPESPATVTVTSTKATIQTTVATVAVTAAACRAWAHGSGGRRVSGSGGARAGADAAAGRGIGHHVRPVARAVDGAPAARVGDPAPPAARLPRAGARL